MLGPAGVVVVVVDVGSLVLDKEVVAVAGGGLEGGGGVPPPPEGQAGAPVVDVLLDVGTVVLEVLLDVGTVVLDDELVVVEDGGLELVGGVVPADVDVEPTSCVLLVDELTRLSAPVTPGKYSS
jgi:hypothetical protein